MTMTKMKPIVIAITILISLTLGARLGFCALTDNCTVAFFQGVVGADVIVDSASLVPAGGGLPEHCRVEGVRAPEDGFILKLPSVWNSRYLQTGNGGAAGAYQETMMDPVLGLGFAVGSGTGGHISPNMIDFSFGYHWWDDPEVMTKVEDYFYGSVHETSILAKKLISVYYGNGPSYSYYNGYSTGGRQALMEAQRYPKDFDGILGGDGPIPFTKRTMGDTWEATQFLGDAYIPLEKLLILADKVEEKCDSIDGLADGLIDDPRKCDFDALTDLPACPNDIDGPTCFTAAQRQAAYNVYDGVRNSKGKLLFKGVSYGSEAIIADGSSGWTMFVPATPGGFTIALGLGGSFVQWIGLTPEKGGPGWDWKTFDVDTDWDIVVDQWADMGDTYDPNLWPFKQSGGKMIYYHGWADALCWANPAPYYYDQVIKKIGSLGETREFFKLYMIPGMTHFAGAGRGVFDSNSFQPVALNALVDWVENGVEPQAFVGVRAAVPGIWSSISRPICPYPEVARYSGTGSIEDAANFSCVPPIEVRIEPETLNLRSKGKFTAFITVPKGYNIRDWNIDNVSCQGAPAVKSMISRNTYIAKFNRQDLVNVTAGDAVTLTVKGTFTHNGQQAQIQASDTIRVIDKGGKPTKKGKK
jgi:feruloyl esterase